MESFSDNDDAVLHADYKLPPQEQSSSEDDSSGDEDPISQLTNHSRGCKRFNGGYNCEPKCSGYLFSLGSRGFG